MTSYGHVLAKPAFCNSARSDQQPAGREPALVHHGSAVRGMQRTDELMPFQ